MFPICTASGDPMGSKYQGAGVNSYRPDRIFQALIPGQCLDLVNAWWGSCRRDGGADTLDGGALRILEQVRIARRRQRIRMPEQRADQWQACAAARQLGREGMPQIVDAQAADAGAPADVRPGLLDLDHVSARARTGKDIFAGL